MIKHFSTKIYFRSVQVPTHLVVITNSANPCKNANREVVPYLRPGSQMGLLGGHFGSLGGGGGSHGWSFSEKVGGAKWLIDWMFYMLNHNNKPVKVRVSRKKTAFFFFHRLVPPTRA